MHFKDLTIIILQLMTLKRLPNINDVEVESRIVKYVGAKTCGVACIGEGVTTPENSCIPQCLSVCFKDLGFFYSVRWQLCKEQSFYKLRFCACNSCIFQAQNKLTKIQYLIDFNNISICILTNLISLLGLSQKNTDICRLCSILKLKLYFDRLLPKGRWEDNDPGKSVVWGKVYERGKLPVTLKLRLKSKNLGSNYFFVSTETTSRPWRFLCFCQDDFSSCVSTKDMHCTLKIVVADVQFIPDIIQILLLKLEIGFYWSHLQDSNSHILVRVY